MNSSSNSSSSSRRRSMETHHYSETLHPYTNLPHLDDPYPYIYHNYPLNPYQDLYSRGEFVRERVEKHFELLHELVNSGASQEAVCKLIDVIFDYALKDWRARERDWILNEEIRKLIEADPLHQKLKEFEDTVLGRTD